METVAERQGGMKLTKSERQTHVTTQCDTAHGGSDDSLRSLKCGSNQANHASRLDLSYIYPIPLNIYILSYDILNGWGVFIFYNLFLSVC
mgnify:CR=1 FL=1